MATNFNSSASIPQAGNVNTLNSGYCTRLAVQRRQQMENQQAGETSENNPGEMHSTGMQLGPRPGELNLRRSERLKNRIKAESVSSVNASPVILPMEQIAVASTSNRDFSCNNEPQDELPSSGIIKAVKHAVNKTVNQRKTQINRNPQKLVSSYSSLNAMNSECRILEEIKSFTCECNESYFSSATPDDISIKTCYCPSSVPSYVVEKKSSKSNTSNDKKATRKNEKHSSSSGEIKKICTCKHDENVTPKKKVPIKRSSTENRKRQQKNARHNLLNQKRGINNKKERKIVWCTCKNQKNTKVINNKRNKLIKRKRTAVNDQQMSVINSNLLCPKEETPRIKPFENATGSALKPKAKTALSRQKLLHNIKDYLLQKFLNK